MCFFVAQFAKLSQMRMRYWNSVNQNTNAFSENFIANGFSHPNLLVLSEVDSTTTLHLAQWGLVPLWVKTQDVAAKVANSTLNARAETIFEKKSFTASAKHSRCIVPVNGFFEWQHSRGKKQPYYIGLKEEDIFSLGGLYSEWTDSTTGVKSQTFSIITVEANPLMSTIHNTKKRMPLILHKEDELAWITSSTNLSKIESLLTPFPDAEMKAHPIQPFNPNSTNSNHSGIISSIQGFNSLF